MGGCEGVCRRGSWLDGWVHAPWHRVPGAFTGEVDGVAGAGLIAGVEMALHARESKAPLTLS